MVGWITDADHGDQKLNKVALRKAYGNKEKENSKSKNRVANSGTV